MFVKNQQRLAQPHALGHPTVIVVLQNPHSQDHVAHYTPLAVVSCTRKTLRVSTTATAGLSIA
jgi:hypothetical protein